MKMRKGDNYSEAYVSKVVYTCEQGHISVVRFSTRVRSFPRYQSCSTCFKPSKYTSSAVKFNRKGKKLLSRVVDSGYLLEEDVHKKPVLQHKNGEFTASHYKALFERRTIEELEALLDKRLKEVRKQYGATASN